jgi:glycosyltransferase involved in cell wall biosynthesis
MKPRLIIVTTVSSTLTSILKNQPKYLDIFFEVILITSPDSGFERISINEGVKVYALPMVRRISPVRDMVSFFRMLKMLLYLNPHVVHSYTPKAGLVAMLAARVCRVPIRIHTFTGLLFPTATGWLKAILILSDRLICHSATKIVPEGKGVKIDLKRFKITSQELKVIGKGNIAGVDMTYFSPNLREVKVSAEKLRFKYNLRRNEFIYCFIGRLNKEKGLDELVSSFRKLSSHTRLLIVGGMDDSSPISSTLFRLINEHSRIHWLGFQEDIRPVLRVSDVLVLPSYREGFPNVVLQAGAMQLPVIASDVNGCNEVIVPGLNGWLVKPKDMENLNQKMKMAFGTNRDTLKNMGLEARKIIKEEFEQKKHWERMKKFYNNLLISKK